MQDKAEPATYQNDVTHWWDLSQIYGSDHSINRKVRTLRDGKLKMDHNKLLLVDQKTGIDITGKINLANLSGNVFVLTKKKHSGEDGIKMVPFEQVF